MTKHEAFDILSERIKDMCINDVLYRNSEEAGLVETMIAILSDLNAVNDVLIKLVTKDGERDADRE